MTSEQYLLRAAALLAMLASWAMAWFLAGQVIQLLAMLSGFVCVVWVLWCDFRGDLLRMMILALAAYAVSSCLAASPRELAERVPGLNRIPGVIRCTGCERDDAGKIKRNPRMVAEFRKRNPVPAQCQPKRSCVVDHIIPLACALVPADHKMLDTPANMQWSTIAEGKAKDLWELQLCRVTSVERQNIARRHGQALPPYFVSIGAVTR